MADNTKSAAFCSECNKMFSRVSNLRVHVAKFHPDKVNDIAAKAPENFECDICQKKFRTKKYFKDHKRTHIPVQNYKLKLTCSMCDYYSEESKELIEHFQNVHDINVVTSSHEFLTYSDFEVWKKEVEHDRKDEYIKGRSDWTTTNQVNKKYQCHRSGNFVSNSKGIRHLKTQGSKKINAFCPASMKVAILSDGKCLVTFCETHVGHQNDLCRLKLTSQEREDLATKISMKIPFIEILNDVRQLVSKSDLGRIHLLTKKDLYNIEQRFSLKSSSVRHKNDALSVEAWVNEMEENGCILFYKPQDTICQDHEELKKEDFVLIIMSSAQKEFLRKYGSDCVCADGTHGLNQYNFELNTLLVLDDLREGFPCAFLVSNRNDEKIMTIFFDHIKEQVGLITAKTFMSDMASSSYKAWEKTMGPTEYRLYCTWHVDRALRKNLSKINSKEKQVATYKYLRIMLQETDEEAFKSMLKQFLVNLGDDPDTIDFANYFNEYYASIAPRWAYCYRLHCGINTNMHLERMHRSTKYIYLQGQRVKRLDKGISAIMQFLRDKLFDRLISMHKGKLSTKLRTLRKRHHISANLQLNEVIEDGANWQVASSSTYEMYTVQEVLKMCTCKLIRTDCSTCIHMYVCSCIDSSVKWNMCKHIHLVCRYRQKQTNCLEMEADKENEHLVMAIDSVNTEAVAIENELRVSQDCGNMSIEQKVMVMKNQMLE